MHRRSVDSDLIQRRGFLFRLGGLIGLPFGLSASSFGASARPRSSGRYYRSTENDLPAGIKDSDWARAARIPICESSLGNEPIFIEAIRRGEILYGSYNRWGNRAVRRISPIQLFQVEYLENEELDVIYEPPLNQNDFPNASQREADPVYLLAWDHDRCDSRTFIASEFSPMFTAPWMRSFAGNPSDADWQSMRTRTEQELRRLDVPPVPVVEGLA